MKEIKFVPQSNSKRCTIAVIRMIRQHYERKVITEAEVISGFGNPTNVGLNGPNINEIADYWKSPELSRLYIYEKGDGQFIADIKAKAKQKYQTMIILNSSGPVFHCVLFLKATRRSITYLDPLLKIQTKTEYDFYLSRKHDDPHILFREVHYVRYRKTRCFPFLQI